jgi:hypothetical protein
VVVLTILLFARGVTDTRSEARSHIDLIGVALSTLGLGSFVFGVLRSSAWGWFLPKAGAPSWLGISLTVWLILAGVLLVWLFFGWDRRGRRPGDRHASAPADRARHGCARVTARLGHGLCGAR